MPGNRLGRKPTPAGLVRREMRYELRASRPTVLRPWRGECLVLRADDKRIRGAPIPPGPSLASEQVVVGPDEILRWCAWPKLPSPCTQKEAARLLGVGLHTILKWCRTGRLVRRPATTRGRGLRWHVEYAPAPEPHRIVLGLKHVPPESFRRLWAPRPALDWAAERFRTLQRRETLIRVRWSMAVPPVGPASRWSWLCPACGRRCYLLYLPAGPMPQWGRHWSDWRFQCDRCTGVLSEGTGHGNNANRWALRMTAGRAGIHEYAPDGDGEFAPQWERWLMGSGPPPPIVP